MRINTTDIPTFAQPMVGNVYPISGGYGRKAGHAMVLIAITRNNVGLLLVIDREGIPVGVTSYGIHSLEERTPCAFVDGLDGLEFNMRPL